MVSYIIRRLLAGILTIFAATIISFAAIQAPGTGSLQVSYTTAARSAMHRDGGNRPGTDDGRDRSAGRWTQAPLGPCR